MIDDLTPVTDHPSFVLARGLPEPWRSHFPKSTKEAQRWNPYEVHHALASRVLAVARTRVECAWAAYCDAVPGINHDREADDVQRHGAKLSEGIARVLFPEFASVPYAK